MRSSIAGLSCKMIMNGALGLDMNSREVVWESII